ncbi:regulator of (H+)-ATPase in vacuolar membrane [Coemansia brasiliensis]|uniref:Regulator of (H+)-ATPase in vacuolar membrane n=1 Tax=Coemansia brasiliensis TaxID=2650707 RepID=A0A9W8I8D4_9FUNG|nr:regulator of (H+)-ATPase in vacuolar membrane [Coemansia brasiliensis]
MIKIWQWVSEHNYMRFHYAVHADTISDIFWHYSEVNQPEDPQSLLLYSVMRGGQLYIWHSTPANDLAWPLGRYSGIRFTVAGILTLSKVSKLNSRTLVAVGAACGSLSVNKEYDGSSNNLQTNRRESTASDEFNSTKLRRSSSGGQLMGSAKPAVSTTENKVVSHDSSPATTSGDLELSRSSAPPTLATTVVISDANAAAIDKLYAVFSDGSLELWKVQHPRHLLSMASGNLVLRTSAMNIQLFSHMHNDFHGLAQSILWPNEIGEHTVAIADSVGHVFVLDITTNDNDTPTAPTPSLRCVWDGHKEPIFHISVDPYSQKMATHSVEGELLIWDVIDAKHSTSSISRKVALEGGQIRTIAWAPAVEEFIAATSKQVFRLSYNQSKEEWTPCDIGLPQMEPYDIIFTYPAADTSKQVLDEQLNAYYISTVSKMTRTVQTWYVAGATKKLEYAGKSVLKQVQQFDRASRVMPVAHPFFSRDNIMATFDTSAGKLNIWGIRTSPKLVWFCAKEHRLPCLNVDMIRYNSIDKAAIVSTDDQGLQTVTIWVFSSASRRSHYLPAGTIYPRCATDRVQEVRWHLTEYAQTYLGIQWDDHIDIYCQERNIDSGWICAHTINAADFGANKHIGSFSFTSAGDPTFSVNKQLFIYLQTKNKPISELAFDEHGELALIHPFVLTELMSWGKIEAVKRLLSMLYEYIRGQSIGNRANTALPLIPMEELLSLDDANSEKSSLNNKDSVRSRYAALLNTGLDNSMLTINTELPDFDQFTQEKADYVLEKLTEIKINGLSPIDQSRLLSIVGTISASQIKDQSIDSMGIRYLVKLQLLELENKRARTSADLPYRELNWALHSQSQGILLQICLQRHAAMGLTWKTARQMGIGVWLSNINALHSEVEKMARNTFIAEGRDPTTCAIFYLALKKQRLLHGLWRTAHNHPEHSKMVAFLAHDFTEARWKTAAAKNAYVLLSRQRYLDAATFFLLSGKLADAAQVCVTQLQDIQLAITICRCYEGDAGPVLKDLLWKHVLPRAFMQQDRWLASLAFGIIHKYDLVLQSLTSDLSKLGAQIGIEAEISSFSAMNVLDTELLILYRSMLNYSSTYRAPLTVQAELIAQTMTIFECLGAPIMSLVVLEWWRKELYHITKQSTTSASLAPAAASATNNSIQTGLLDMSAFSGFAGFGNGSAKVQKSSAADSIATGTLSMDSFESMFPNMSLGSNLRNHKPTTHADSLSNAPPHSKMDRISTTESSSQDIEQDLLLAVDIEDTPVQYACRVTLALQIIEFITRSKAASKQLEHIDLDKEKETVARTLRLPQTVFPTP